MNLEIPESISQSLRLPVTEITPRLLSELAESSRFGFADLLTRREIPRHYTDDEFTQDLGYAYGQ